MVRTSQKAIKAFGCSNQVNKLIEELSELLVAVIHFRDGKVPLSSPISEIVDVQIMIQQYKLILEEQTGQKIEPLIQEITAVKVDSILKLIKSKEDKRRKK